jgi:hypothetical protein
VLFQAIHDIIGNPVAFILAQTLPQSPDKLGSAPQSISDGEAEHLAFGPHSLNRTQREQISKRRPVIV